MARLLAATGRIDTGGIDQEQQLAIRGDVALLALRQSIGDNATAYNLSNSFIDQFQDDSGIGSETNVNRNVLEYVEPTSDPNTVLLLHMDDVGLTDSSVNNIGTNVFGGFARSDAIDDPFGNSSGYSAVSSTSSYFYTDTLTGATVAGPTTGDWTVDGWYYPTAWSAYQRVFTQNGENVRGGTGAPITSWSPWVPTNNFSMHGQYWDGSAWQEDGATGTSPGTSPTLDTWIHLAYQRKGGDLYYYYDGVIYAATTRNNWGDTDFSEYRNDFGISGRSGSTAEMIAGYIDEVRYSNIARYTTGADGTTQFTPETEPYSNYSESGEMIGKANVPSAEQTKVSGVMLYKDGIGEATIGTDLQIWFTCNGSNYVQAASYTTVTPAFSGDIKMVKLGETTCPVGSDVRYKAVWENQGTLKVTQLHGIGLNY